MDVELLDQPAVSTERPSAVGLVTTYIRQAMREGRLVPGQRLVEPDLIATLGVSRGTVREALTRLQGEGLIEFERHRGARVRILTRAKVLELNQIRAVVEGLGARLAAENATDADVAHLLAVQLPFEEASKDYSAYNEQLHNTILGMSRNESLSGFVSATLLESFRLHFWQTLLKHAVTLRSYSEHEAVVDAIVNRRPEEAEKRMVEHVHGSCAAIMASPDHYFAR